MQGIVWSHKTMRKSPKLPLALLGAGLVIALAFFGWSAEAKDDATFHLANEVKVTNDYGYTNNTI